MALASRCPSTLALDELLVGELQVARAVEVTQHVDACANCRERIDVLRVERETFLERAPAFEDVRAAAFATALPRRGRLRRAARWWAPLATGLTAAAVLLLWLRQRAPEGETPASRSPIEVGRAGEASPSGSTRTKGRAGALSFYVKRGEEISRGHAGMTLRPRDGLRFAFTLTSPGYCGVWGIDAQGVASPYFAGSELVLLPANGEQPMPSAVGLDESIGREQLIGVVCERPTKTEVVTFALASNPHTLQVPEGCSVDALEVNKRR